MAKKRMRGGKKKEDDKEMDDSPWHYGLGRGVYN